MDEKREKEQLSLYRKIIRVIAVVLILGGVVYAGHWLIWRIGHVTTNAAYIKADIANVAPEVPGKIICVSVSEGQRVSPGHILLKIDPEEMGSRVSLAKADLAAINAKKKRYEAELKLAKESIPATIAAARAALDASYRVMAKAQVNRNHWGSQYRRFEKLVKQGVVGESRFEEVETAWNAACADYDASQAQVRLAKARLVEAEASLSVIEKARAAVQEACDGIVKAEEALALAQLNHSRCDVKAPIGGIVARVLAEEGDFASPGRPVVGIYDPATRYVEARFEETKIRFLDSGKEVELTVDSMPGRPLKGRIVHVVPASAAEFALIPRDVSAGEFTKVVQRIPVKISIENLENHPELLPGLSVEVIVAR